MLQRARWLEARAKLHRSYEVIVDDFRWFGRLTKTAERLRVMEETASMIEAVELIVSSGRCNTEEEIELVINLGEYWVGTLLKLSEGLPEVIIKGEEVE